MNYALYALAAILVLGTLYAVANVGKPREALTVGDTALIVMLNAGFIVVLVLAALRLS